MRKRSNPSSSPDAPIAKHAKGRGQSPRAFGRGRSCSFESPASHVHHGLRAAASSRRRHEAACHWCDSSATVASVRGGENDQCDLHSKFHQQVMSVMPWHTLVACYKDATPQVQRDMDAAVTTHAAGSGRQSLLDEHVSNSTTISREVYMKFSLVPESELEREFGSLRSMEGLLDGIPKTKHFYPGTSQQMTFYVFPRIHERPDFPVLKVLTANDARQHIQVMGPACELYAAQGRQILEHLENRAATPGFSDPNERGNMVSWATFLGRKDKQSVAVNDPEMSLRKEGLEAQWMIDGGEPSTSCGSFAAKKIRPAVGQRGALASACTSNGSECVPNSVDALDEADMEIGFGGSSTAPSLRSATGKLNFGDASTVGEDNFELGDNEEEHVLARNKKRCDLWGAAVHGKQGNNRYQCERAAKQQRGRNNLKLAGELEIWAQKVVDCEMLAAANILKATPEQVAKGVAVLTNEYGELPDVIPFRLVAWRVKRTIDTCERPNVDEILDIAFP